MPDRRDELALLGKEAFPGTGFTRDQEVAAACFCAPSPTVPNYGSRNIAFKARNDCSPTENILP